GSVTVAVSSIVSSSRTAASLLPSRISHRASAWRVRVPCTSASCVVIQTLNPRAWPRTYPMASPVRPAPATPRTRQGFTMSLPHPPPGRPLVLHDRLWNLDGNPNRQFQNLPVSLQRQANKLALEPLSPSPATNIVHAPAVHREEPISGVNSRASSRTIGG